MVASPASASCWIPSSTRRARSGIQRLDVPLPPSMARRISPARGLSSGHRRFFHHLRGPWRNDILDRAPAPRFPRSIGAGLDEVDPAALRSRGIRAASARRVNRDGYGRGTDPGYRLPGARTVGSATRCLVFTQPLDS